ncbi:MAG TPA: hypothetical protein VMS94_02350 [Acidobacteriota bacterium]|nr:hypothetical protein [Acidobacteriota bacterium]
MKKAPLGMTFVAVLTLLGAIGDLLFFATWVALGAMGHAGTYLPPPPISFWIVLFNSLVLSVISVVASIGMFQGASYAWYLSIILWVFSAVHYCYAASLIFTGENLTSMAGIAILVNTAFIVYFLSRQVRDYFLNHRTD